jgi:hypothetical protein
MTGDRIGENSSGRCSGRVESTSVEHAQIPPHGPVSAPESLTPSLVITGRLRPAGPPERHQKQPTRRTSRTQIQDLKESLSPRDRAILAALQTHRFLATSHIQDFFFHAHATTGAASRICRRVLARLAEARIIDHLERRVGGVRAGSASYVWRVGVVGDQLLRIEAGEGSRTRFKEPSDRWLAHCLAIADTHLQLRTAARQHEIELVTFDTEPVCWRPHLGSSGSRLTLKPDAYAVTASGEFEDHWYLEIDLGTESLPTLLRKCGQYEVFRRTGRDQHDRGITPIVVWLVSTTARASKLTAAIRGARSLDTDLFRITTRDGLLDVIRGGAA